MAREALRIERIEALRPILERPAVHRVSVHLPVETSPTERSKHELRVRACLERVRARLAERGLAEDEAEAWRARLADDVPPVTQLPATAQSLVCLADDAGTAWSARPDATEERVVVASHFALRPLLRSLSRDRRFRVLAVSPKRVAAFEGDAKGLRPLAVDGLPPDLEAALGEEVEGKGVQQRAERPVPGRASNAPIFHGHGGADEERGVDRERFHRVLARALESAWGDDEVALVLAAPVRGASELRQHLRLPGLLEKEARGNFDQASPAELHEATWPLVREAFAARERALAEAHERARNLGKSLARDFDALGEAALAGRVRRLWVEEDARVAGRFDPGSGRRQAVEDPDEDALDGLVAEVLRRAGEVHVVAEGEGPAEGAFCAELR